MTDDEDDIALDWSAAKEAAHAGQLARGDRQDLTDVRKQRRPPRGPAAPKRAKMIPFPLSRRRSFVEKLAAQIAARPADAGETHLMQQLTRQGEVLRRKGIPERAIDGELRALMAAVRAELWRLLLGGRGA